MNIDLPPQVADRASVYIVDDDYLHVELAQSILSDAGWNVKGSSCQPEAGLREIEQLRPEIVLLDIRFGSNFHIGFDLARRIRDEAEASGHASPFIVFVTGHGDEQTREKARTFPGSLYYEKPFEAHGLVDAFEKAVERLNHLRDCQWALAKLEATGFAERSGDYIAVFGKDVVGDGDDEQVLREQVSRDLSIHPERVVIEYKGNLP